MQNVDNNDYYAKRIMELEKEIEGIKQDKENAEKGDFKDYKVGCSENNSGGSFWLNKEQYIKLRDAGFIIFPNARAFYKKVSARTEEEATATVKNDFWYITGQDPDDEGCNCCGKPFNFSVDDEFYWETPSEWGGSIRPIILDE